MIWVEKFPTTYRFLHGERRALAGPREGPGAAEGPLSVRVRETPPAQKNRPPGTRPPGPGAWRPGSGWPPGPRGLEASRFRVRNPAEKEQINHARRKKNSGLFFLGAAENVKKKGGGVRVGGVGIELLLCSTPCPPAPVP